MNQTYHYRKVNQTQKKAVKEEMRDKNKSCDIKKTVNKMAGVSPSLSVITLNVSELNFPIERQRLAASKDMLSPKF